MSSSQQYVSCIKIGGKPIIPPLITPKRREECLRYRMQAIDLEKKKERNQLFKQCMEDLGRLEGQTKDLSSQSTLVIPLNCTLENQLAFAEDNSPSHVPYATYKKLQNLKTETVDVSEYSNEGVKVLNKSPISEETPTPKLIRSNSYTLDSPSPILLAHLEKEARKCLEMNDSDADSRSLSPVTIIDSEISVQKVTISTPMNGIEPQLMAVLEQLPADHANNIIKILEKQQEDNHKTKKLVEALEPMSVSVSSQSLYYSMSSPDTPKPRGDISVVNLKNVQNNNYPTDLRKEWAASKIGAAVRGYLTRRLIRTEKVQTLIETIKDALLCAIQLHGSEVIEEADVELHRRLIQQVSAACYAFHDIFFTLSVKEQMNIISKDRQRKKEKALRPLSANSSNISIHRRRSSKATR